MSVPRLQYLIFLTFLFIFFWSKWEPDAKYSKNARNIPVIGFYLHLKSFFFRDAQDARLQARFIMVVFIHTHTHFVFIYTLHSFS